MVWGFCSFVLFVLLTQGPPCVTQADRELIEIWSGTWAIPPCVTKKFFLLSFNISSVYRNAVDFYVAFVF